MKAIKQASIASLLALLSASPIAAQEAPPPAKPVNFAQMSDDELRAVLQGQMRIVEGEAVGEVDSCGTFLPAIREFRKRNPERAQALLGLQRGADMDCAKDEGRHADAYRMLKENEAANLPVPDAATIVWMAYQAKDYDDALKRLDTLVEQPGGLGQFDFGMFWGMIHEYEGRDKETFKERMFRTVEGAADYDKFAHLYAEGFATHRFQRAIVAKEYDHAKKLLPLQKNPRYFIPWLADRRYEPLWPQLEAKTGDGMRGLSAPHAQNVLAHYQQDTTIRMAFNDAAHTLYYAGRYDDAVALARTFDHSPASLAKASEEDFWGLNAEAYALDMLKRHDEAEALLDNLVTARADDPEAKYWLTSFAINRAERLIDFGKYAKGLQAMEQAATFPGTPHAEMLVRRGKICALTQLNRETEAAAIAEEAYQKRKDSYGPAADALLCAGNENRAAAVTIEALQDPEHRSDMLELLQPREYADTYRKTTLPTLANVVLKRADVKAVFDQYGRIIPDRFKPVAPEYR